ncbi:aldehyde dehydrogenase family protein [uncultured Nocardioides sp.]|uniref:aldehyde dehydrogenase family protein n=1 Tax=uncultured Nocardioides sp. TaxID=198441 RepID=UPI002615CC7D|nr:aldehyde dehydrogenase family protein [uncultured Nocardioides sp.]
MSRLTISLPPAQQLVDGKLTGASDGATYPILDPATGQEIGVAPDSSAADVDAAIAAARRAFDESAWATDRALRVRCLRQLHAALTEEAEEFKALTTAEVGMPGFMMTAAGFDVPVEGLRWVTDLLESYEFETDLGEAQPMGIPTRRTVRREPVGVVAAISPWNVPTQINLAKIGPALAAGCTVVLKPAPDTPWVAAELGRLVAERTDMPAGVLNVVMPRSNEVASQLTSDPRVDMVSFTGSTNTGRAIMAAAAPTLKKVFLELGGKSANVVFADAKNLTEAAAVSAAGIFRNSGQVCVAGSRLLVERSVHDDFVAELAKAAKSMRVGDPLDLTTQAGAINNATQLAQNLSFVETAQAEGGTLYQGGQRVLEDTGGYFMEPTIITDVAAHHSVAQKEVFGPVLAVTAFEDEDDAIRLANSTDYGLAGGVWTSDLSRAHRMVREMHTGVVHVNTYGGPDVTVPMGGVKQSGNGHDKSLHALDKFLDLKTAWVKL